MEIEYTEKYDLFRKGNYIKSFESMDDFEEYMNNEYKWMKLDCVNCPDTVNEKMNLREYTLISSKHVKFT